MSNSSLVTYTKLSPNCTSPRENKIIGVAIHCMVAPWTAKTCADYFSHSSAQASSTYCVGYDGSIAQSVDEADRPWTTSSRSVDSRCVTIEVASETNPPYAVTDGAYRALIELCADICRRNNIPKLVWSDYASTRVTWANGVNMQVHRDYEAKSCPGEYLYSRMQDIADRVNAILAGGSVVYEAPETIIETESEVCEVTARVLGVGDEGNDVLLVQTYCNSIGCSCGVPDGIFGEQTKKGVIAFQKKRFPKQKAEWDGVVGSNTWNEILRA